MFVVTGGGSGIGRALACALAAQQNKVLVVGRREDALIETAAHFSEISYLAVDLSKSEGRARIAEHLKSVPKISGLIHNAGVIEPIAPIHALSEHDWQHNMAVNVFAPLFLTQALLNQLSGGRVLNVGSGAAYFPIVGWSAYCVSKAALSMLTRCWQLESDTVAFTSVMPGIIDTPMQSKIRQAVHMEPEKLQFFQQLKQKKQLISVETVALFLCWLLLEVSQAEYESKEWDIYDVTHHPRWLSPPHSIPPLED